MDLDFSLDGDVAFECTVTAAVRFSLTVAATNAECRDAVKASLARCSTVLCAASDYTVAIVVGASVWANQEAGTKPILALPLK